MNFHVALGLDRDMRDEPTALTYFLRDPVTILGKERDHLNLEIYHFDPILAPEGSWSSDSAKRTAGCFTDLAAEPNMPVRAKRYLALHGIPHAWIPRR
jgi:hypothetical protein